MYVDMISFHNVKNDQDTCISIAISLNGHGTQSLHAAAAVPCMIDCFMTKIQCDGLADCCQITMNMKSHAIPRVRIGDHF